MNPRKSEDELDEIFTQKGAIRTDEGDVYWTDEYYKVKQAIKDLIDRQVKEAISYAKKEARIDEVNRFPVGKYIAKKHAINTGSDAGWGVTHGNNQKVADIRAYKKERFNTLKEQSSKGEQNE